MHNGIKTINESYRVFNNYNKNRYQTQLTALANNFQYNHNQSQQYPRRQTRLNNNSWKENTNRQGFRTSYATPNRNLNRYNRNSNHFVRFNTKVMKKNFDPKKPPYTIHHINGRAIRLHDDFYHNICPTRNCQHKCSYANCKGDMCKHMECIDMPKKNRLELLNREQEEWKGLSRRNKMQRFNTYKENKDQDRWKNIPLKNRFERLSRNEKEEDQGEGNSENEGEKLRQSEGITISIKTTGPENTPDDYVKVLTRNREGNRNTRKIIEKDSEQKLEQNKQINALVTSSDKNELNQNSQINTESLAPIPGGLFQIDAEINPKNFNPIPIRVLVDSGSTISIVSKKAILSFPDMGFKVRKTDLNLIHAGEKSSKINEIIELPMTIKQGDQVLSFTNEYLISDTLPYEIILGNNILGKVLDKLDYTNNTVDFNLNYRTKNCAPRIMKVTTSPFYELTANQPAMIALQTITVPCFSSSKIKSRLVQGSKHIKTNASFMCESHPRADSQIIPIILKNKSFESHTLLVINETPNDITVNSGDILAQVLEVEDDNIEKIPQEIIKQVMNAQLAEISPEKEEHEYCALPMKVNMFKRAIDQQKKKLARKAARQELQKDPTLTRDEIEQKLKEFDEKGFYTQTATQIEENNNKLVNLNHFEDHYLTDKEIIDSIKIDHLSKEHGKLVVDLTERYIDIFSRDDLDCEETPLMKAEFKIKEEYKGVHFAAKALPIQPQIRERLDLIIDRLLAHGIVRRCDDEYSPIISNIIAVKKPGSKYGIRITLDSRFQNLIAHKLSGSLLSQEELFEQFNGRNFITHMDLSNAYWSLGLPYDQQPYFSFRNSKRQKFCFTRAVQGFASSSTALDSLITMVIAGIDGVVSYADDIFIMSNEGDTFEDHINKIEVVFQSLQKAKLKIKGSKLKIDHPLLDVLGFTWNKGKFSIQQSKVQAFTCFPIPTSPRLLKAFLASVSFLRRFLPNFAEKAYCLYKASTLHHTQFKFDKEMTDNYYSIIEDIQTAPAIFPPNAEKDFFIQCDASKHSLSGIVYQMSPDNERLLIGAYSRQLTRSEINYSTLKKEILALMCVLLSHDYILRFAPKIHVFLDARSLLFLRYAGSSNPLLTRFCLTLSNYEISLTHISSTENKLGDLLSRIPNKELQEVEKVQPMSEKEAVNLLEKLTLPEGLQIGVEQYKQLLKAEGLPSLIEKKIRQSKASRVQITPYTLRPKTVAPKKVTLPTPQNRYWNRQKLHPTTNFYDIWEEQNLFQNLPQLFATTIELETELNLDVEQFELNSKILEEAQITIAEFREAQNNDEFCNKIKSRPLKRDYKIKQGILLKVGRDKERLVLPTSLLNILLYATHFSIRGHHNGKTAIKRIIDEQYYIENVQQKIDTFVGSCYYCVRDRMDNSKQHIFREIPKAKQPRHTYHYDILGGLIEQNREKYIYVFVDQFSNFTQLIKATSKTAEELLRCFQDHIIQPFGKPQVLVSDGESSTKSNIFRDYCQMNNIQIRNTAAYSPNSNSQAELMVKKAKTILRTYAHQTKNNWSKDLGLIQHALNATKLSYCDYTPEELQFGSASKNDTDILSLTDKCYSIDEYVAKIRSVSSQRNREIDKIRTKRNEAYRVIANRNRKEYEYYVGQIVFIRDNAITPIQGGGLAYRFLGPYIINKLNMDNSTCIVVDLKTNSTRKTHFKHLRPIADTWRPYGIHPTNEALKLISQNRVSPYSLRNQRLK